MMVIFVVFITALLLALFASFLVNHADKEPPVTVVYDSTGTVIDAPTVTSQNELTPQN